MAPLRIKYLYAGFVPCTFVITSCLACTACSSAELLSETEEAVEVEQPGGKTRTQAFTVLTYNVENFFDVDGVAMFDDYLIEDESEPFSYSRRKFQTKLENAAAAIKTFNSGEGPEILLLQELEADFTPESDVTDYDAFLKQHAGQTLGDMLGAEWREVYAGYPSHAWLLKALDDVRVDGYEVAVSPSYGMDSGIAHANAVFSKFPIRHVELHRLEQARDIVEAELDVGGHPLIVYVNHWKSGASNPDREPIRVQNAEVLRALLDARLAEDPNADIIVAGDLNSHYNHSLLFPDLETGINDVLGSSGEEAMRENDLYNLWFELPPEARYAEVWRGNRGTLMHMLLTPGLYDGQGISYVDNSFDKLVLPGLNADAIGRPLRWSFAGKTGGGSTDHFPIYAHFRVGAFEQDGDFSQGDDAPSQELPLTVSTFEGELDPPDGHFLSELSDAELAPYVGQLYTVNATVKSLRPLRLQVEDRLWHAYYADSAIFEEDGLPAYIKDHEGRVRLIVQPNFYRGQNQLIIEAIVGLVAEDGAESRRAF